MAYTAGTDTVCILEGQPSNVTGAYEEGSLSVATMDRALRRLFEALVILGYFDPPSDNEYREYGWSDVNTPYAQDLAREASSKGIVMLKNDGFLPHGFSTSEKVATIGEYTRRGV